MHIIFEGDYVRKVDSEEFLRVDEIIIVDVDYANNKLRLSDESIVPAPVEDYIAEVISSAEYARKVA